jgi:hypothetical protein
MLTRERVTELRIHGVSGSDGPTMLGYPAPLQMAGGAITGFHRAWNPDGEGGPALAGSCRRIRGRTDRVGAGVGIVAGAGAVHDLRSGTFHASRGEPELESLHPGWLHPVAHAVLRLLALAAIRQFVIAVATLAVSTVDWQAVGHPEVLPRWMGWHSHRPRLGRCPRLAVCRRRGAPAVGISAATANRYKARTTSRNQFRKS